AFLYMPSPAPQMASDTLFSASRASTGAELEINSGNLEFYEYGTMPDHSARSATALPLDRWTCVEWSVGGGMSLTWLDGNELTDIHFVGTATAPFTDLVIGAYLFQATNQAATDLWMDDLMIDGAPIGCAR